MFRYLMCPGADGVALPFKELSALMRQPDVDILGVEVVVDLGDARRAV